MSVPLPARDVMLAQKSYRMNELLVNAFAASAPWEDWEEWLDPVFEAAFKCAHGSFLDVGVNLGQTLLKMLTYDPARQYIGFDPQPACCFMVQRFIDENRLTNCRIVPVGLYDQNGIVTLYGGADDFSALSTVVDGFRPNAFYSSRRFVSVRKGDDALADIGCPPVGIIKVDVEGGELEVLAGLSETLRARMPVLIFEVLNHFIVATNSPLDEETIRLRNTRLTQMEALLRGIGYEILNIWPDARLKRVSEIIPLISSDMTKTNYIALAASAVPEFLRNFPGEYLD